MADVIALGTTMMGLELAGFVEDVIPPPPLVAALPLSPLECGLLVRSDDDDGGGGGGGGLLPLLLLLGKRLAPSSAATTS